MNLIKAHKYHVSILIFKSLKDCIFIRQFCYLISRKNLFII